MIKKIFVPVLGFTILILIAINAIAQGEEEIETRYPSAAGEFTEEIRTPGTLKMGKWDIDYDFSTFQGYDNNASLDSSKQHDTFTQNTFGLGAEYKLSDSSKIKCRLDETDITYWEYTDASLLDAAAAIGLEGNPNDNLILYAGYEFDILYYLKNERSNYLGHRGEISLKHLISDVFYQKIGYDYLFKEYSERQARDAAGTRTKDREDSRHTIKYEIGAYPTDKILLKAKSFYFYNDSNDQYLDYYDYNAYKAALSVIYLITEKFYAYANGGYEFRDYKNRNVLNKNKDQEDDIWTASCALFYDLTESVSLGANYSYRENSSNDGSQEYAGSIVSAGVYYAF